MPSNPSPSGFVTALEDVVLDQPRVPRADRRLGDSESCGDAAERLAAVLLERLDQPAVERVDRARPRDRAAPTLVGSLRASCCCCGPAQCAKTRITTFAFRQFGVENALYSVEPCEIVGP
jgi:hypothetical protein